MRTQTSGVPDVFAGNIAPIDMDIDMNIVETTSEEESVISNFLHKKSSSGILMRLMKSLNLNFHSFATL